MLEFIDNCFDAVFRFLDGVGFVFYQGLGAGISLSVITALIYREFLLFRKKKKLFFDTIEPSLKSSPSGFARMLGFVGAVIRMGILMLAFLFLMVACARSLVVP